MPAACTAGGRPRFSPPPAVARPSSTSRAESGPASSSCSSRAGHPGTVRSESYLVSSPTTEPATSRTHAALSALTRLVKFEYGSGAGGRGGISREAEDGVTTTDEVHVAVYDATPWHVKGHERGLEPVGRPELVEQPRRCDQLHVRGRDHGGGPAWSWYTMRPSWATSVQLLAAARAPRA